MHLPGTKKSDKRKASVVSVGDEVPVEKKEVKREKKKAKPNQRKGEKKAESLTPDPQHTKPVITHSPATPIAMSPSDRVDSVTESYVSIHPSFLPSLPPSLHTKLHTNPPTPQSPIHNPHPRTHRPHPTPQLAHQKFPAQRCADMGQGAAVH